MSNYSTKEHTCAICDVKFTGRKKKYCSTDCSNVARRKRNRDRFRKENGLYDKYNKERKCKYCSKDISDRELHAVYCDNNCGDMFRYFETTTAMPREEYYEKIAEQAEEAKRKRLANKTITMYRPECLECGERLMTLNANKRLCSRRCKSRRKNKRKNNRIPIAQMVDRDITLDKLFKRDKGLCYLCNEPCDPEAFTVTEEGHYIVGPSYPSIDHVVAIANNGMHAWNNIKLAHHRCNTLKRDIKLEEYIRASV